MVTDVYWVRLGLVSNIQCLLFSNLNKTLNKLSTTVHNAKAIRVTVLFFPLSKILAILTLSQQVTAKQENSFNTCSLKSEILYLYHCLE